MGNVTSVTNVSVSCKAPRLVGRPPADAGVGLVRLDNGEIRYYPFEGVFRLGDHEVVKYIRSRDQGWTWEEEGYDGPPELLGARTIRRNPITGGCFAVEGRFRWFARALHIDGQWERWETGFDPSLIRSVRDIYFTKAGQRLLVPAHGEKECFVFYSDDRGATWQKSNRLTVPDHTSNERDQAPRWNHGAAEPCIVELREGRLCMLIRTAQDMHYQSISKDGGVTWSLPEPSRFFGTCTMPTIGRLDDGRLLMMWNNTLPMPELPGPRREGWEDVFTNRDAIHVAISQDDGQTWRGFRELHLDERRNESDYAETGGVDRGAHQSEFLDVGDGWVLAAYGQHPLHRRMAMFHTDWLYETKRVDDFSHSLENWSTFAYLTGIRGHCAYNRQESARLIDHPHEPGRRVLHIRRLLDPSLVSDYDGATWNFPTGTTGTLITRIYLPHGSQGGRISLLDRWVNPTDDTTGQYAMYTLTFSGDAKLSPKAHLSPGEWHEMKFVWLGVKNRQRDQCQFFMDGRPILRLPLHCSSDNGISYVQFISNATLDDPLGFFVERVEAEVE